MMVDANYIVAIDMETSRFVGMVGRKNEDGTVSVLAAEREDAGGSIRRGNIYHKESAGRLMKRLVEKLQNRIVDKLPDFRIRKVYVGVGGQSLRSVEHFEMKTLSLGATVSGNDLRALDEQCRTYRPDMEDVVGMAPPVYYVDGKRAEQPEGLSAGRIEAHYKLIVGRPSIRHCVMDCVKLAGLQLAELIVSPLSLAGATLSREEKETGCALVGFDTGVTSVAVYQQGALVHLSVIPLGVRLIVGDLMKTLKLREQDAEWLKTTYGLSLAGKGKNAGHPQEKIAIEGREIESKRLNAIIEGRAKEIVENVYERIRSAVDIASLKSGIVLAGNASGLEKLPELPELLHQRFNLEVTSASLRKERVERNGNGAGDPEYMTAISLLIQGTENCLQHIPPPKPEPEPAGGGEARPDGGRVGDPGGKSDRQKGKNGLSQLINRIKAGDMFGEDH